MRYEITLNGKVYEVEVVDNRALVGAIQDALPLPEPVEGAVASRPTPVVRTVGAPLATAPRGVPTVAPAAPPTRPRPPQGEPLPAPMPGLVKEIRVRPGQPVKSGQPLVILEAMKMENEIVAPYPAVVTEVVATKGQTVPAGAPLLRLAKQ